MKFRDSVSFLAKRSKYKYQNYLYYLIIITGFFLSILLRLSLFEFQSGDFQTYLSIWYKFILEHDKFWALEHNFSNYNPSYLYLMVIISYLFPSLPSLYAIKLISIIFDLICAFFVYKIVELKYRDSRLPAIASIIFLFTPTIFINSAFWGQADVIYTSGLLACLYFILVKRNILSLICFGLAFSVKQQAVFLAPLILILLLKRKISWLYVLIIPCIYLLMLIPAWIAGRPLQDLLTIYLNQANTYNSLTKNAPNIYQWIPNDFYNIVAPLGLLFAAVVVLLFIAGIYQSKVNLNNDLIIQIALLSCLIIPYCLPKMHERYFYAADVISVISFFYFPKGWYIPIIVVYTSLFSYTEFLLHKRMVSLHVLSLIMAVLIIVLLYQFNRKLHK